jgi:hypothetical protein
VNGNKDPYEMIIESNKGKLLFGLTKLLSGRIYQELYIVGGENGDIIY